MKTMSNRWMLRLKDNRAFVLNEDQMQRNPGAFQEITAQQKDALAAHAVQLAQMRGQPASQAYPSPQVTLPAFDTPAPIPQGQYCDPGQMAAAWKAGVADPNGGMYTPPSPPFPQNVNPAFVPRPTFDQSTANTVDLTPPKTEPLPDEALDGMTRLQLSDYAKARHGKFLNPVRMTKEAMLEEIRNAEHGG